MNKKKQIEEMARDICKCYKGCECNPDDFENAQLLYEKGYRKAIEVAREIFRDLELDVRGAIVLLNFERDENVRNIKTECYKDLLEYLAEIRKIYTEDEG